MSKRTNPCREDGDGVSASTIVNNLSISTQSGDEKLAEVQRPRPAYYFDEDGRPKVDCLPCGKKKISVRLEQGKKGGTVVDLGTYWRHWNKYCPCNPNKAQYVSLSGLTIGDHPDCGPLGSGDQFQFPIDMLGNRQLSTAGLEHGIHVFSDGSSHPIVGMLSKAPMQHVQFFKGTRCCYSAERSVVRYQTGGAATYPNFFDADGKCKLKELRLGEESCLPEAKLRMISCHDLHREMTCAVCNHAIKVSFGHVDAGTGICNYCEGGKKCCGSPSCTTCNSFGHRLREQGMNLEMVPFMGPTGEMLTAFHIRENYAKKVTLICKAEDDEGKVCGHTFDRKPTAQTNSLSGCGKCNRRNVSERRIHRIVKGLYPSIPDSGYNRLFEARYFYDIWVPEKNTVLEVMSTRFHLDFDQRQRRDIDKMLLALRKHKIYIMCHCEDCFRSPWRLVKQEEAFARAFQEIEDDPTPRLIHISTPKGSGYKMHTGSRYAYLTKAAKKAGFRCDDIHILPIGHRAKKLEK